jgi:hypothetical protein
MPVTRWTPATFLREGYGTRYSWIDFVNSDYHDGLGGTADYLRDKSWLEVFLSVAGLPVVSRPSAPRRALEELRATLRAATEDIANEGAVSTATLHSLNRSSHEGELELG